MINHPIVEIYSYQELQTIVGTGVLDGPFSEPSQEARKLIKEANGNCANKFD